jgi:phasin family protein
MVDAEDTQPNAAAAQETPSVQADASSPKQDRRRKMAASAAESQGAAAPVTLPGITSDLPQPASKGAASKAPASKAPAAVVAPKTASAAKPRKIVPAPVTAKPPVPPVADPAVVADPGIAHLTSAKAETISSDSTAPRTAAPTSTDSPVLPKFISIKDMTMDMTANFSGFQDAMSEAQAKAQAAFEKSSNMLGEVGEFTKGNVEAVVASGKILAEGFQELGSTMVAESRTVFESMTGDLKELAAAKSPTDLLKLQSDMVRKNFDNAVAYGSKNSEAMLKLMNDMMAPISGRVSLAVEKARQIAPMNATV